MVTNEQDLAEAIMNHESRIELPEGLLGGVEKIKYPSSIVWKSVAAALVASAFFWGSGQAVMLGIMVGLPAILAVCGGVGGVVFVPLGASGTLCAFRLLSIAKTMDVLTDLRDKYNMDDNVLTRK